MSIISEAIAQLPHDNLCCRNHVCPCRHVLQSASSPTRRRRACTMPLRPPRRPPAPTTSTHKHTVQYAQCVPRYLIGTYQKFTLDVGQCGLWVTVTLWVPYGVTTGNSHVPSSAPTTSSELRRSFTKAPRQKVVVGYQVGRKTACLLSSYKVGRSPPPPRQAAASDSVVAPKATHHTAHIANTHVTRFAPKAPHQRVIVG